MGDSNTSFLDCELFSGCKELSSYVCPVPSMYCMLQLQITMTWKHPNVRGIPSCKIRDPVDVIALSAVKHPCGEGFKLAFWISVVRGVGVLGSSAEV